MTDASGPSPRAAGQPQPYLTADLPPIGGRLRERPEDFFVDEQPLYQPQGSGEHIYLFIEKRDLATTGVVDVLSRHFGVPRRAIGYAGLKDRKAVTRQVFSVHAPGRRIEDFPMLQHDRLGVLWADYHANKLRRGHLAGNRFSIRVRGVEPRGALVARAVLDRLEKSGVPNRIGEQRFGYLGRNHLVGRAILLGDARAVLDALLAPAEHVPQDSQRRGRELYAQGRYADAQAAMSGESRTERRALAALARGQPPERAVDSLEEDERGFFLTAFQSAIFNAVLDERVRAGALAELRTGDVAFKHDSRAVFDVDESAAADPQTAERLATLQISPSGPMWGAVMKRAWGRTAEIEAACLAATGVTEADMTRYDAKHPAMIAGERRPLRVPLIDPDVEGGLDEHGPYVRVAFELPRGAFATTVLREIMKPEEAPADSDGGAE